MSALVSAYTSFSSVTLLMSTQGWEFEVLPPTAADFETGERTFRCLAGKGDDALTEPTLYR